uniref:Uncharacterized 20.3 kDa protein in rpl12-rps7 intergenic region n=1 Tax=Euglena longa TaxID=3037 RepID=YCY6_EUGLO|nr:hypothetical protein AsloCp37 [Euglena longa]P14759.1 RecName: Full=Uncharacterized 20.3 kDa protein in rpl12-rps7 intergenic region; AltName: Full=ORF167 [Euglena longa]CAC24608.1 hypothetical protein [Euglena longa]
MNSNEIKAILEKIKKKLTNQVNKIKNIFIYIIYLKEYLNQLYEKKYFYREINDENYWKKYSNIEIYINGKKIGTSENINKSEYILLDLFMNGPIKININKKDKIYEITNIRKLRYLMLLYLGIVSKINIVFQQITPPTLNYEKNYKTEEIVDNYFVLHVYVWNEIKK